MRLGDNLIVGQSDFATSTMSAAANETFRFVARQPIKLNRVVLVANGVVGVGLEIEVRTYTDPFDTVTPKLLCTLVLPHTMAAGGDVTSRRIVDDYAELGSSLDTTRVEPGGSVELAITVTSAGTFFGCIEYTPLPFPANGKTQRGTDIVDVTPEPQTQ